MSQPGGPSSQRLIVSGVLMAANTLARGASKTREIASSLSEGMLSVRSLIERSLD